MNIFTKIVLVFMCMNPQFSLAQIRTETDKNNLYSCNVCHGLQGVSPNEEWPNIAGQKKKYLFEQLKKFKNGSRIHLLMSPVSALLSESEMDSLAEYFSKLRTL